jgi:Fe-S-cluster containining protein
MSDDNANVPDDLKRLERQIERGGLFTHSALSSSADRINDAEAFLYGLVDLLIEKGLLTSDELAEKAQAVRQEMQEKGQTVGPGVALRVDNPDDARNQFKPVNCAERLHICKAACCKLGFPLSAAEVEGGNVKWDLGQPYYIRHEADGYCSHIERETLGCGIYENRPGVCRAYSCANDERIWLDFDNMILNEKWINEHTGGDQPRLARASMIRIEDIK